MLEALVELEGTANVFPAYMVRESAESRWLNIIISRFVMFLFLEGGLFFGLFSCYNAKDTGGSSVAIWIDGEHCAICMQQVPLSKSVAVGLRVVVGSTLAAINKRFTDEGQAPYFWAA